jgi:hypothetical protein
MFLPRQIAHVSSPRADVQGDSFPFPQHSAPIITAAGMALCWDDNEDDTQPSLFRYGVVVGDAS